MRSIFDPEKFTRFPATTNPYQSVHLKARKQFNTVFNKVLNYKRSDSQRVITVLILSQSNWGADVI